MRDWRSWVQFPWVTSTFNVDIARIFVFYLAMVRNCCGLLWQRSGGCSCLPYTMSAKAVRWVPLDRNRCTLYKINKSMLYMFVVSGHLYRPLLSSQSWELRGKILGGFGTYPRTFLGAGLSVLVFFWHLSPAGSTMWRGLKNRSDTYSFALWAPTHSLCLCAHADLFRGRK